MSLIHNSASFNHFCLKTPVNPSSRLPSPSYERWKEKSDEQDTKFSKPSGVNLGLDNFSVKQKRSKSCSSRPDSSVISQDFKSIQSFLDFYSNIPDLSDVNHLSEKEFYLTLENLKLAQKKFCGKNESLLGYDSPAVGDGGSVLTSCTDETFNPKKSVRKSSSRSKNVSQTPTRSRNRTKKCSSDRTLYERDITCDETWKIQDKTQNLNKNEKDVKNTKNKKNQEETKYKPAPKKLYSNSNNSYIDCYLNLAKESQNVEYNSDEHECYNGEEHYTTTNNNFDSGSSLLFDVWDKNSHHIMTGEEDHECEVYYDEFLSRDDYCLPCRPASGTKCRGKQNKFAKSKLTMPVPLKLNARNKKSNLSQCEIKGHSCYFNQKQSPKKSVIKANKVPLESSIPLYEKIVAEQEARRRKNHARFSKELRSMVRPFSFTKRDEAVQRTRLTCSNPDLSSSTQTHVSFRAKPVPKNLFSNFTYEKMREDDFYRALKKRVRAEELLKSSSLPPSMAAREKHTRDNRDHCNSYNLANVSVKNDLEYRNQAKRSGYKRRRGGRTLGRRHSTPDTSSDLSPYLITPESGSKIRARSTSSICNNRNNLASLLRMQTSRQKIEKKIAKQMEECKAKEEVRFKERLVRMTPSWRALNYDTEEDLAMRLATRREEERMQRESHRQLMESIYGRVHQIPPLFERHARSTTNHSTNNNLKGWQEEGSKKYKEVDSSGGDTEQESLLNKDNVRNKKKKKKKENEKTSGESSVVDDEDDEGLEADSDEDYH